MRNVKLGDSGLEVSRLGLGCMGLSEFYGPATAPAEAEKVLSRALELGVNFLDTADMYGSGANEELLSGFVSGNRDRVVLATKFGLVRGEDASFRGVDNNPDYIRAACEASLRRLKTDVIDLYYMHRRDRDIPIEDSVGAMADLVKAGKVRAIGLSEVTAGTLRAAHAVHPIAAVQSEYSLGMRIMEDDVIPACWDLGVAFVAYSPLGRGLLTGAIRNAGMLAEDDFRRTAQPRFQGAAFEKNISLVDAIAPIAEAKGATQAQIVLAWLLARGDNIIPIPGTTKVHRVEENVGALDVDLTPDDIASLERAMPAGAIDGARYPESSASTLNG